MSVMRRITAACLGAAALAGLGALPANADPLPTGEFRLAKLEGTNLSIKENNIYAGWTPERGDVAKFEIDGNRIGVLTTSGEVYVKEGNLFADWILQTGDVTDFHIAGNLIGVRRSNGILSVKDGSLWAGWNDLIGDVVDFDLTPSRVGVIQTGGEALVKEGVGGGWVPMMGGIADIELAGDRVALVRTNKSLTVKEGDLYAGWNELIGDVIAFDVTDTRVGVVQTDHVARVKEGGLGGEWIPQMGGIDDIELSGDLIALIRTNRTLPVKQGSLFADWTEHGNAVVQTDVTTGTKATPPSASVTIQDLRAIYGAIGNESTVIEGLPSLNAEMARGGITTRERKAAFLATLRHESGFRYNAVEVSNPDGFRGRGYIQLPGAANYSAAGSYLNVDLTNNPDLAASLQWSAAIARYYWTVARSGTNAAADRYDMGLISRYIGYRASSAEDMERCADFKKALSYFNGGSLPVPDGSIVCLRH